LPGAGIAYRDTIFQWIACITRAPFLFVNLLAVLMNFY
jgi:hypothetical protein